MESAARLNALVLTVCLVCTFADNNSTSVEVNSEYQRLTVGAVFAVIGLPLVLCLCCLCNCAYGCSKSGYKDMGEYDDLSENEGLVTVIFKKEKLGLGFRKGLVTEVTKEAAANNVRLNDKLWSVEGQMVKDMTGKEQFTILMAHKERPMTIQFLRPSETNIKVRAGIQKHETQNFRAVTTGKHKGIETFVSMSNPTARDGAYAANTYMQIDNAPGMPPLPPPSHR